MINLFRDKFPATLKLLPSILFGGVFLNLNYQWLSPKLPEIVLTCFFWIGIILIVLPVIVFVLEFLSKLFPVFKIVLNFIIQITNFVVNIYVWIIKLLIKQAVVSILEEKKNLTSEQFTLKNSDGKDEYWTRTLDFSDERLLELTIEPKQGSEYWRLGFKFSGNNIFSAARHSLTNPLLHLTKDIGHKDLKIDYYNDSQPNETVRGIQIIPSYRDTEIRMTLQLEEGDQNLKLKIFNNQNENIYQKDLSISLHRYARLFAWGDGKAYEIKIKNNIEKNSNEK